MRSTTRCGLAYASFVFGVCAWIPLNAVESRVDTAKPHTSDGRVAVVVSTPRTVLTAPTTNFRSKQSQNAWNPSESGVAASLRSSPGSHPTNNNFLDPANSLNTHHVPFFPSTSRAENNKGLLRIVNVDSTDSEVTIKAFDDDGEEFGRITFNVSAGHTISLDAADLENGNESKGLNQGLGTGTGDWRLTLSSTTKIDALVYMTAGEALYSTLHDVIEPTDDEYWIPLVPGNGELSTGSYLRLTNLNDQVVDVTIRGRDDSGVLGDQVSLSLDSHHSRWLSIADLEAGEGVDGKLGDLDGNWRLTVRANAPIQVMAFVSNDSEVLSNLSSVHRAYSMPTDENEIAVVDSRTAWLPGTASDRDAFLRVINRSDRSSQVTISAQDESETTFDDLSLTLDSFEAVHLSASDLEQGNSSKALTGSLGAGQGNWRLTAASDLNFEIASYVRSPDATLASLVAVAPMRHASNVRVAQLLNTADSAVTNQLRFDNESDAEAQIHIVGTDEAGVQSESVSLTLEGGGSTTITSDALINGSDDLSGNLGSGTGRWRLAIWSDKHIQVVNLLDSADHLLNVSSTTTSIQHVRASSSVGDFNGDGKLDILLRHIDGRWFYFPMDRSSPIPEEQGEIAFETSLNWQLVGIGDFDADGQEDALLRHTDGSWMGYLMNGKDVNSSGSVNLTAELEWTYQGIGEFTGDGKSDVLLRHNDGRWRIDALDGLNVDDSQGGEISLRTDLDWRIGGLGDLNGDGRTDIVLRHRTTGEWLHALMNDALTPAVDALTNISNELSWNSVALVDLNGDEKDDLLLRHSDGRWLYYSMDGSSVAAEQEIPNLTRSWRWQFIGKGDLSGDGRDELLLRHSDGRWMSYRMEGSDTIAGVRASVSLTRNLAWSTFHPVPWTTSQSTPTETAKSVFEESVSEPIIQSKCINCHVSGGQSGTTRLVFVRSSDDQHLELNRKQFEEFLADVTDGKNRILNKVQGNLSHGGGTQLTAGSDDYKNLEKFLNLLEEESSTDSSLPLVYKP